MESIVAANMRSRPTRAMISILAVAIGVIMMLIIGGIVSGTLNDYLGRIVGVGADFMIQQSNASVFFALNTAALPQKLDQKIKEIPGVEAVAPVLSNFSTANFSLIFGIDLASYNELPGRLQIMDGRESLAGDEVIIDELYAKDHPELRPGSALTLLNHTFTVSGICRQNSVVRIFVPLKTLQQLNESSGKVTFMFIKAARGADVRGLGDALKRAFPGYLFRDANDMATLLAGARMPMYRQFRIAVVAISMLLSFMVVLVAMYSTIFERTREIGILKSMGASRRFIVGMILKETVIISGLGVLFGIGISLLARKAIVTAFPTLQVSMSLAEVMIACALGLIGSALGALYPAYKAARMDPVKALAYE